jgi:DNA-binding transcriptional LysR family regulator
MFLRIGELGSLSKAAHRMRIAQPALSRQMKLLQEDIGVRLLMRHRHGMRLTPAGEELMRRLAGLIRQLDQAVEDVRSAECTISRNGPARFRVNGPTLHGLPAEPRFESSTRPFSLRQVF